MTQHAQNGVLNTEREERLNTYLKDQRFKVGMTQAEVAYKSNITERSYQYYEAGNREPSVKTAIRIAKALDSTVEKLFGAATPNNTKAPDGNLANK